MSDNDSLCDFVNDDNLFIMDNNISFSNGLAEIVNNNFYFRNFNNDDLNYIFSCESKQGEINEREIIYSL